MIPNILRKNVNNNCMNSLQYYVYGNYHNPHTIKLWSRQDYCSLSDNADVRTEIEYIARKPSCSLTNYTIIKDNHTFTKLSDLIREPYNCCYDDYYDYCTQLDKWLKYTISKEKKEIKKSWLLKTLGVILLRKC